MKRAGMFLMALLALCVWNVGGASTKGIPVTAKTSDGGQVDLYRNSYALLIGVSDYTGGWSDLTQVQRELDDVESMLNDQGFKVTRKRNPDSQTLERIFEDFIDQHGYEPENRLLFFFSGHGYTRRGGSKGYLVPSDAPDPIDDERGFLRKALSMSKILAWARIIESKHALFLFDSCFSGTVFKAKGLPSKPPLISGLTAKPVRQFITAGDAGEEVPAKSTFTPVFVDGLKYGKADLDKDGYVTGTELGIYLRGEVPKYVQQTPQFGKIRDYELARGDFVFLLPGPPPPGYRPPMVPVAPAPPPVLKGYLQIVVGPVAAQVTVNGRPVGRTQPGKALELRNMPVGQAAVVVSAPGHKGVSRTVVIQPNQWTQEMMTLVPEGPALATLTVRSNVRGDAVSIDGRSYGPTRVDAELSPGPHVVEVSKAEHETWRETVTLSAGEKRTLRARLERKAPSATAIPAPVSRPVPRRQASRQSYEPEMVSIRGGCYQMGSPSGEKNRDGDEHRHRVCVEDFKIGKYEVTQSQWRSVMGNNPSTFSGCDNCPVERVSWNEVNAYIDKLNRKTGKRYRLPTEAQWEYAARAGTTMAYWWGERASHDNANYGKDTCCGGLAKGKDRWENTSPVGSFRPNPWGLYDTAGNVYEWTCSGYDKDYGGGEKRCVSKNHAGYLAIRGGSWFNKPRYVRSAIRNWNWPGLRNFDIGFRLAQD